MFSRPKNPLKPAYRVIFCAFLLAATTEIASAAFTADWPGAWAEAEAGVAHPNSIQYASGHAAVDLQNQPGAVALQITTTAAQPGSIFYLRYARDAKDASAGAVDVYVGPADAKSFADSGVRSIGHLALPSTGRLNTWQWVRLPAGDLEAGPHKVFLVCPPGQSAGYLDLVGFVPGSTKGLWRGPNNVVLGAFSDSPAILPAFELLGVDDPTYGDLLPTPTYLGPTAKDVSIALKIRNNLFTGALSLSVHGELVGDDGKTIALPAEPFAVPADSTQPIAYTFKLPGEGHFKMKLIAEAEGVTAEASRVLTTVPAEPIWVTPPGDKGKPQELSGSGSTKSIKLEIPTALPAALIYVSYQRRARDEADLSEQMDVLIGPAGAKDATAAGVRKLGQVTLNTLSRFGPQEQWVVVNAGELPAGAYQLLLALPGKATPLDPAHRPATDVIKQVGVVADVDHGRWLPPITSLDSKNVTTVQDAQLIAEAVHVEAVNCGEVGHLFLASKVLEPKPAKLPFSVTLSSRIVTEDLDIVVTGRLIDAAGVATPLPEDALSLKAGERQTIEYPITAPAVGWYSVEVTAHAEHLTDTGHSSFGILLDPHPGVRPDSIFGLSIGDKAEDAHVAELIGVKWRRGIPFTNPADVVHKSGDPLVRKPDDTYTLWNDKDIQKAKDAIALWKNAGVMCLGYVNYNLPWNCLGGAAGGWHKNRPDDMKEHVEMVYNLIKPLHDEVKYWEIWNEPWVGGWTWRTGTAQDYRDMCRMIWDRVKPEMPDVMLVGGGSTAYDRDVVFPVNSPNAGYVDGVSSHPYGKPDTNHPSSAATEAAMMKKFGHDDGTGAGKGGIWVTELGTAAFMFEPLPRAEADLMVARTVAPLYLFSKLGAQDTPIHLFFFASLYGAGQFSGGEHNWWDATGGTPAPRPALVAYSTLTHFIEDSRLIGDIYSASKAAWAIHYVKADGSSVVVFIQEQSAAGDIDPVHAADSERAKGEMLLPAGDFEVYDYLGRKIGVREGDHLRIPTQVWEARYIVSKLPVEQVRQAMLDARFTGLPSLVVNPRSFDAPLASKPKLRFKVENLLPQPMDAKIDVTAPAELQLASTSAEVNALKPGEVRWISFDLTAATPNDVNRYLIKYRVTTPDGSHDEQQTVQVACATFGTPKIDGDLADWKNAIPVTMISRGGKDWRQIAMDPSQAAGLLAQKRPSDTAMYRLWTQWDAEHFYVAAVVPTGKQDLAVPYDGPISTTRNMPFMHDCLQLAFACLPGNPDDLLREHPLYEKSMAADVDYEFAAALLSNNKPELTRLKAPGTNFETFYPTNGATTPALGPVKSAGAQVSVRYNEDLKSYVYEVAIPWSEIKELGDQVCRLQAGQSLATHFAFAVNDTKGSGRSFWTQEAGDLEAGSYGFSPNWGGGGRNFGGRVETDWGFSR